MAFFGRIASLVDTKAWPAANDAAGCRKRNTTAIAAALLCVVMPFELTHLAFMLVGVVGYMIFATLAGDENRIPHKARALTPHSPLQTARKPPLRPAHKPCAPSVAVVDEVRPVEKPTAPKFYVSGWEAEIAELLEHITPTNACIAAVAAIARKAKRAVRPVFPDAVVVGYVGGSLTGGKSFAVAVPDVDIVIGVPHAELLNKMQKNELDSRKYGIRACNPFLTKTLGMKFHRPSFRGREPKVAFKLPATMGICSRTVPLEFSINSVVPWRNASLIEECGRAEPSVKALVLLVKRWAKDRGIAHAAKGNLPPYAWTLLSIYYLQVGVDDINLDETRAWPPLPSLEECAAPGWPHSTGASGQEGCAVGDVGGVASPAKLFSGFLRFYAREFDWSREAVCVRLGRRTLPGASRVLADGVEVLVPSVEDPFEPSWNLADGMTAAAVERLHEELSRADALRAADASLTVLLEPWVQIAEENEAKPGQWLRKSCSPLGSVAERKRLWMDRNRKNSTVAEEN